MDKTTPIELARALKWKIAFKQGIPIKLSTIDVMALKLVKAVIDSPVGLTKGELMPQTPEEFAYMAEKYEEALLREKEENSRLRAKLNKLEQKVTKAHQRGHAEGEKEQKEKDAKLIQDILDSHKVGTGDCESGCDFVIAWETAIEAIREG